MEKRIEYRIDGDKLYITKQTHRGKEFGENGTNQWGKDFILHSFCRPSSIMEGGCYMRGEEQKMDNAPIHIPSPEWLEKFKCTVKEYNEHFGDGKEKDV